MRAIPSMLLAALLVATPLVLLMPGAPAMAQAPASSGAAEAELRMARLKAEARRKGSRMVVCVRFETTTIASGWAPAMEVFAYGTALVPDDDECGEAEALATLDGF